MSFRVWSLALSVEIDEAIRRISSELFARTPPTVLHHYTSASAVESVTRTRVLWATCVGEQKDKNEITLSSEWVAQLAEEDSSLEIPVFASDVLRRLAFFMEERKPWIYIACFCDDKNSPFHWREYGDYCLTFPSPWTGAPSLALESFQTDCDCWYQAVAYDENLQRCAIKRALQSIVKAISRHTAVCNEGPWAQALVDRCARNAAQSLLGMVASFKHQDFKDEREWRIICAPRLASNNSAPESIDQSFNINVRCSPRRHICLQLQRKHRFLEPSVRSPVPFLQVARRPGLEDEKELGAVNNALRENHRADLLLG